MQRMLCLLLAAAALCGCADRERYRLSGSVEGAEGVLLLTNLCTSEVDSARVDPKGRFRFEGRLSEAARRCSAPPTDGSPRGSSSSRARLS